MFLLFSTDTSLDSSELDMSNPQKSKKRKKRKQHQTPVKQLQQQQHGDSLQTLDTSDDGQTRSSHKKHKRKRRRDDDPETNLLLFKHQKLGDSIGDSIGDSGGDMTKGTNTLVTPSTPQTVSDIGSPFKTKHKKHKSKT